MKYKYLIILIFISLSVCLSADIQVHFNNSKDKYTIKSKNIDSADYFAIEELQRVFKASKITEDRLENRLTVSMYNETISLLINSSYLSYRGTIYNLSADIVFENNTWYIPVSFLKVALPTIFSQKLKYNSKTNILSADTVKDTRVKIIVLDPGHGGKDPGATGKLSLEKDITLDMAYLVKEKLEKQIDGVKVLLTRSRDEFVSLQARTQFANNQHAHLFISLHCNAALAKTSQGIETFFLSTARTTESRAVEALENSVVMTYEGGQEAVKNYDDLQMILADLHQSEQLEESSNLALRLQSSLIESTNGVDRGVKQAGFYVLRGAFMPSVLVELGFISNEEEEKKLMDKAYQQTLADSIVRGIKSFKQKYDFIE